MPLAVLSTVPECDVAVTATAKQILLALLVAAFAIQTALVYSDERAAPLNEAAIRGRELWHANACQVCHQIYGNGGFLGPDLTNAASRVDTIRLRSLLTEGSGQMPAFHFAEQEIADLRAYLEALDRPERGRGQLRLGQGAVGPWERFGQVMAARVTTADSAVGRGWERFRTRPCVGCHLPFATSPGGAPDLSRTTSTLSPSDLLQVLTDGRPGRGMPAPTPPLDARDRDDLAAFFTWLAEHRAALVTPLRAAEAERSLDWRAIPWWEYR